MHAQVLPPLQSLVLLNTDWEKSRSQSLTFWHIQEKYFLIPKLGLSIGHFGPLINHKVSKFDNYSLFCALWFFKDLFTKNSNWIFFNFFMIFSRINKGVYLSLFEHANTRKHVYEHNCSSVRVFLSIFAHLAHLAQSVFFIWNAMNK